MTLTIEAHLADLMSEKKNLGPKNIAARLVLEARGALEVSNLSKAGDEDLKGALDAKFQKWQQFVDLATRKGLNIDPNLFEEVLKRALPEIYGRWRPAELSETTV